MNHTHRSHAPMHDIQKRLALSLAITVPILFVHFFPFSGSSILLFLLSTILYIYGGMPFFKGMHQELQEKRPGMMTLVGTALTVAYAYSTAVLFGLPGVLFYVELATLIDIMLLGHWIEMRSVLSASKALERLARLLPAQAHVIGADGSVQDIPVSQVVPNMLTRVHPGEKIPADGVIVEGLSEVNQAVLTGEARPVVKRTGDTVIAGAINGDGTLTVRVTKDQKSTYIATVIHLVAQVLESKSHAQDLADRAAFILTIVALLGGVLTFALWQLISGNLAASLERMVTVMVTACPHALGLAIPLVTLGITTQAAQRGILIRNRKAFENAYKVGLIAFDKTGTLTRGLLEITDVISLGTLNEDKLLAIGASTEKFSKHALATAMLAKAEALHLSVPQATEGKTLPGKGVQARIDGVDYFIGTHQLLEMFHITSSADTQADVFKRAEELMKEGKTVSFIATNHDILGLVAASDIIRQESFAACKALKKRDVVLALITGDNAYSARLVARALGIEIVRASVAPQQKAVEIQELKKQGFVVAMVGDGINDAPALSVADVGIAIGAGTDVALATADIILVRSDPRDILDVIGLSQLAHRKIAQNIFLATAYNVIALPLSAGVLAPYGLILSPALGALAMAGSTIVVAINSRFIRYKQAAEQIKSAHE